MKMHEKKLKKFGVYSTIANVLFILVVVLGSILIVAAVGAVFYLKATDNNMVDVVSFIFKNANLAASLIFPNGIVTSHDIAYIMIIQKTSAIALIAYIIKSVAVIFRNISKNKTPLFKSKQWTAI